MRLDTEVQLINIFFISDNIVITMAGAFPEGSKRKTRHTSGSKVSEYIGLGQDFLPSEVPTLRGALRKVLLIQEKHILEDDCDRRNLPLVEILAQVAESVLAQWRKSNVKLSPPVIITGNALSQRLKTAWENISLIARGKAKKADKAKWEMKLDKLLDLTVCQCKISICQGLPTKKCPLPGKKECMGHISCDCVKDMKLPLLELKWIYFQRVKVGEKSGMGMVSGDIVETKRQVKAENRVAEDKAVVVNYTNRREKDDRVMKNHFREIDEPLLSSCQPADPVGISLIADSEDEDSEPDLPDLPTPPVPGELLHPEQPLENENGSKKGARRKEVVKRNLLPISSTAEASLRFDVSSTAAAAICNGFLADLIRGKVVPPDSTYLALDKCKLQRARQSVMAKSREEGDIKCKDGTTKGIYFDSRKDKTMVSVL